jgi:hypothetical protein
MKLTLHRVLHPDQYSCAQGRKSLTPQQVCEALWRVASGPPGVCASWRWISRRHLTSYRMNICSEFWNGTVTVRRSEVLFPPCAQRHGRACVLTDICLTVSQ